MFLFRWRIFLAEWKNNVRVNVKDITRMIVISNKSELIQQYQKKGLIFILNEMEIIIIFNIIKLDTETVFFCIVTTGK